MRFTLAREGAERDCLARRSNVFVGMGPTLGLGEESYTRRARKHKSERASAARQRLERLGVERIPVGIEGEHAVEPGQENLDVQDSQYREQ